MGGEPRAGEGSGVIPEMVLDGILVSLLLWFFFFVHFRGYR